MTLAVELEYQRNSLRLNIHKALWAGSSCVAHEAWYHCDCAKKYQASYLKKVSELGFLQRCGEGFPCVSLMYMVGQCSEPHFWTSEPAVRDCSRRSVHVKEHEKGLPILQLRRNYRAGLCIDCLKPRGSSFPHEKCRDTEAMGNHEMATEKDTEIKDFMQEFALL